MKTSLLLCLALLLAFAGCKKKDENNPGPQDEQITVTKLTDKDFIQYIEVPGSEKIIFDASRRAYIIMLPASFEEESVKIHFKLYPHAFLTEGLNGGSAELIGYVYRNKAPHYIQVSSANQKLQDYQIYVTHNGPLKATIYADEDFESDPDGNVSFGVNITSGLGTIPASPTATEPLQAILKDEITGTERSGSYSGSILYFNNALPLANSGRISVTLKYGNQTVKLAQNKKLKLMKTIVYGIGNLPLLFAVPFNKEVEISGNGFSVRGRYTLKFDSDFLSKPIVSNADYVELTRLTTKVPADLPNGEYSVSVFNQDTLINSLVHTISTNEKEKSIGQMWTIPNDYPTVSRTYFFAKRLVLEKGKSVFATPFPAFYTQSSLDSSPKELPDLQLKNGTQTISIKAAIKSDPSYGDGSIRIYYGEYFIPNDATPGFYEARHIYADKSVSVPFWSKIEIK